jgi:hypothetical protein
MRKVNWDGVIDVVQNSMVWFVILLTATCVLSLVLFDVLAGAGIMMYLTNQKGWESLIISLATSGLLISLMVSAYSLIESSNKKNAGWGLIVLVPVIAIYLLDVYFDSLTADYLRYGAILPLTDVQNPTVHLLFRCLIGGISTVGETLAMAIIVGMPVIKQILHKAMPQSQPQINPPKPPKAKWDPKVAYSKVPNNIPMKGHNIPMYPPKKAPGLDNHRPVPQYGREMDDDS